MKKKKENMELEEFDQEVKKRWLKKEISLEQLPAELKQLVGSVKKNKVKFEKWKEYLRVKCKLDEVAKNGEAVIISIVAFVFSAISCISDMGLNMGENMNFTMFLCMIAMGIGVAIVTISVIRPYMGNYTRERTFYELLLYYAEEEDNE